MLILAVSHCVTHHVGFTIPSSELDARVLAFDHHSNCHLAILPLNACLPNTRIDEVMASYVISTNHRYHE